MSTDRRSIADTARQAATVAGILVDRWRDPRQRPWRRRGVNWRAVCNVCGWNGASFDGPYHSEFAACPSCGSVARDRFVHRCLTARTAPKQTKRLLETSPRLGEDYRDVMSRRYDYLCSDFDLGAHRANLRLDLQDIDLPSDSLDVVLTAHVLEHVPDYKRALAELHRVLRPGGVLILNVPVVAAATSVPTEPEYHGDDTLVYWRFGFDLADELRSVGFRTETLVPEELRFRAEARDVEWAREHASDVHDAEDMVRNVDPATLTDVAGLDLSRRLGFLPAYMFVVFEGRKPAP